MPSWGLALISDQRFSCCTSWRWPQVSLFSSVSSQRRLKCYNPTLSLAYLVSAHTLLRLSSPVLPRLLVPKPCLGTHLSAKLCFAPAEVRDGRESRNRALR